MTMSSKTSGSSSTSSGSPSKPSSGRRSTSQSREPLSPALVRANLKQMVELTSAARDAEAQGDSRNAHRALVSAIKLLLPTKHALRVAKREQTATSRSSGSPSGGRTGRPTVTTQVSS